jgi:hypothetical protein
MRPEATPHLDELAPDYEVIGEVAAAVPSYARQYLARRRSDDLPVIVSVSRTPENDEGNALSLFAADANLLKALSHRSLLPVLDGRWLGQDAFAVVSERPSAPTLGEMLEREQLSYPRIAAVLQEVSGLLEWARRQKIAHRVVTPEVVFLEPASERVLASFVISPIPFGRVSPTGTDARTIAELAERMLRDRDDVARKVRDGMSALKSVSPAGDTSPDIPSFVALVGMNDALRMGDVEYDHARHAIEELREEARRQLESAQRQHDSEMEAQRKELERERQELRRELEREREALARERAAVQAEYADLTAQRASVERERAKAAERTSPSEPSAVRGARQQGASTFVRLKSRLRRVRIRRGWLPWNRRWSVQSASVALVVLIVLAAVVSEGGRFRASGVAASSPLESLPVRIADSAGGESERWAVPLPGHVPESAYVAAAMADTARMRRLARARAARDERRYQPISPLGESQYQPTAAAQPVRPRGDSAVRTDTIAPRPAPVIPFGSFGFPMAPPSRSAPSTPQPQRPPLDSARRGDTLSRPLPDTTARPDAPARPQTG